MNARINTEYYWIVFEEKHILRNHEPKIDYFCLSSLLVFWEQTDLTPLISEITILFTVLTSPTHSGCFLMAENNENKW